MVRIIGGVDVLGRGGSGKEGELELSGYYCRSCLCGWYVGDRCCSAAVVEGRKEAHGSKGFIYFFYPGNWYLWKFQYLMFDWWVSSHVKSIHFSAILILPYLFQQSPSSFEDYEVKVFKEILLLDSYNLFNNYLSLYWLIRTIHKGNTDASEKNFMDDEKIRESGCFEKGGEWREGGLDFGNGLSAQMYLWLIYRSRGLQHRLLKEGSQFIVVKRGLYTFSVQGTTAKWNSLMGLSDHGK